MGDGFERWAQLVEPRPPSQIRFRVRTILAEQGSPHVRSGLLQNQLSRSGRPRPSRFVWLHLGRPPPLPPPPTPYRCCAISGKVGSGSASPTPGTLGAKRRPTSPRRSECLAGRTHTFSRNLPGSLLPYGYERSRWAHLEVVLAVALERTKRHPNATAQPKRASPVTGSGF